MTKCFVLRHEINRHGHVDSSQNTNTEYLTFYHLSSWDQNNV